MLVFLLEPQDPRGDCIGETLSLI